MTVLCGNKPALGLLLLILCNCSTPLIAAPGDQKVLLIQPVATATYLKAADPDSASGEWLKTWRALLDSSGKAHETAPDDDAFMFAHLGEFNCVILPQTICLSEALLNNLTQYLNNGGGVIVTGSFASRDSDGNWVGSSFLEQFLGSGPETSPYKPNQPVALEVRWGAPGSLSLTPGCRLTFTPRHTPLTLTPDSTLAHIGGRWSSPVFDPAQDHPMTPGAAYVFRQILEGGGRLAWLGVNPEDLVAIDTLRGEEREFFGQLFNWSCGDGFAVVDPWPAGCRTALIINYRMDKGIADLPDVRTRLKALGIPATFSVLYSQPAQDYDLLKQQKTSGDFDFLLEFKLDGRLVPSPVRALLSRLVASANPPCGLSIPAGVSDSNFTALLNEQNIPFVLIDTFGREAYPRKINDNLPTLILKRMTSTVDEAAATSKSSQPDTLAEYFLKELQHITDAGGLCFFSLSDSRLVDHDPEPLLKPALNYAEKKGNAWLTSPSALVRWITQRDSVDVKCWRQGEKFKISVVNNSRTPLKDGVLRALPNRPMVSESVNITDLSKTCLYDINDGYVFIKLPRIEPGETFTAALESRGGMALTTDTKRLLFLIFKIILGAALLFLAAFLFYFTRSRKKLKPSNVLSPDGDERRPMMADSDFEEVDYKQPSNIERPIARARLSISPENVFGSRPFPPAATADSVKSPPIDVEADVSIDVSWDSSNRLPDRKAGPPVASQKVVPTAEMPTAAPLTLKPEMLNFARIRGGELSAVSSKRYARSVDLPPSPIFSDESTVKSEKSGFPANKEPSSPTQRDERGKRDSRLSSDWLKESHPPVFSSSPSDKPADKDSLDATLPQRRESHALTRLRSGAKYPDFDFDFDKIPIGDNASIISEALISRADLQDVEKSAPAKKQSSESASGGTDRRINAPAASQQGQGYRSTAPLPGAQSAPPVAPGQLGAQASQVPGTDVRNPPSTQAPSGRVTVPLPSSKPTFEPKKPIIATEKTAARATAPLPSAPPTPKASVPSASAPQPAASKPQRPQATAPRLQQDAISKARSQTPSPANKRPLSSPEKPKTSVSILEQKAKEPKKPSSDWL